MKVLSWFFAGYLLVLSTSVVCGALLIGDEDLKKNCGYQPVVADLIFPVRPIACGLNRLMRHPL